MGLFRSKRLEVITGGVFLSITLLVAVFGILSYRSFEAYRLTQQRIATVSEQLRALNITLSTLQDAETGQRGYLLTRKPSYLEPYSQSVASAGAKLAWLRQAFAAEPQYHDELDSIENLKTLKFAELAKTIDLVETGSRHAALAIVNSDSGKAAMDQIRSTISTMQAAKRKELAAIQAAAIKRTRDGERATFAFGLAVAAFLLAAYWFLIYDLRDRRRLRSAGKSTDSLDRVTGIYNADFLARALSSSMKHADRDKDPLALMLVELRVSPTAQDAAGDKHGLTIVAAKLLAHCVPDPHVLAQLGDKTFAVLVRSFRDRHDLALLAQNIANELTLKLIPTVSDKYLDVRMGIAIYPDDARTRDEVMSFAKLALRDDAHGRNSRYTFYHQARSPSPDREEILIRGLHQAIEAKGFTLRYQPQLILATGEIIGAEALIRWEHPELGPIPPDEFIPIAERTGLIIPIGAWVLDAACREAASWSELGPGIKLAVNVSALQLNDADFLSIVNLALANSGLTPSRLEIELTERVMTNREIANVLMQVRSMGVHISIDDFGTGYSSLSYLSRFPANILKIDRSFINNVPSSARDSSVARTIINIGRELGITTVAEGVENREQADFLARHGCDVGQGYLFYKPLPAEELRGLLAIEQGALRRACVKPPVPVCPGGQAHSAPDPAP